MIRVSFALALLLTAAGCAAPPEVKLEKAILLQFDVSPAKADDDKTKSPRELKILWEAVLADMEADPATKHLLQELFTGLPIELQVPEENTPEALGAPPPQDGALILRVAEREPPHIVPLGTGWHRCVLLVDLARVGTLIRDTPKTSSKLVYDGASGALKLAVEAYLRRKLKAWSFGATPRRTTIGQRVEVYKQRNAWRRGE